MYFTLLDDGVYLGSQSSCYRMLRAHGEVRERRRQATHPAKVRPSSWPTRRWSCGRGTSPSCKGPNRGVYYDLYVVIDIFSRYVVAWCVAPIESGELAKELIADAVVRHQVAAGPAHHPRRPGLVDDVEPGDRTAHLPRASDAATAAPTSQRQPLQ